MGFELKSTRVLRGSSVSGLPPTVMDENVFGFRGDPSRRQAMECVIFIGIQGSGKSAFFKQEFADTHLRINRDMLKTKSREAKFFELCLATGQRCVIDNTNPTRDSRRDF